MDRENILAEKTTTVETKLDTKPKVDPTRTAEYPQIREAVGRIVREYGEALQKLAKND